MSDAISGFYSPPPVQHGAGGLTTQAPEAGNGPLAEFYHPGTPTEPPLGGSLEEFYRPASAMDASGDAVNGSEHGAIEPTNGGEVSWPDGLDPAHPVAREFAELGLDGSAQQRVLDLIPKYEAARDARLVEEMRAERNAWVSDSRRLPSGTIEDAREAFSNFRSIPGLADLMEETGLGDHPAVIRMFAEVTRMVRSTGRR